MVRIKSRKTGLLESWKSGELAWIEEKPVKSDKNQMNLSIGLSELSTPQRWFKKV